MNSDDEVVSIPLKGYLAGLDSRCALVSGCHAPVVMRMNWVLTKDGYAHSTDGGRITKLHLLIHSLKTGTSPPFMLPDGRPGVVDHINRDRLDNRASNLRLITQIENTWNRTKSEMSNITQKKDGTYTVKLRRNGEVIKYDKIATLDDAKAIRDSFNV